MGKLLIDEYPLIVLPSLAVKIGLNEAIFLQQLNYWLASSQHERDGRKWIFNSFEEWANQFPFWSIPTIKRIVQALRESGLIITTSQYNKMALDRTLWYTIDYDKLDSINLIQSSDQNDTTIVSSLNSGKYQVDTSNNQRLPETTKKREGTDSPTPPAQSRPSPSLSDTEKQETEKPARKRGLVTSPHIDPRKFKDGYIEVGKGTTPIEVYYERFSINDESARLSAPLEDDLRKCVDLDKFRSVIVAYSQSSYKKRNIKLILDWYNKGIPEYARQPGVGTAAPLLTLKQWCLKKYHTDNPKFVDVVPEATIYEQYEQYKRQAH